MNKPPAKQFDNERSFLLVLKVGIFKGNIPKIKQHIKNDKPPNNFIIVISIYKLKKFCNNLKHKLIKSINKWHKIKWCICY